MDSIAFAPGRSEAHVAELARVAREGRQLDPVAIIAFGDTWMLVDGHHRLAAYGQAGWSRDIPVRTLVSDLRGNDRITWAIEQSFADNAKNRLNLSVTDKADGAWLAVAKRVEPSKAETAARFGVSERTVANMRNVRKGLEGLGVPPTTYPRWTTAQRKLQRAQGDDAKPSADWDAHRRRIARRLQPVMAMQIPPDQLAEALEQYSPGIIEAMAEAWRQRGNPSADELGI